MVFRWQSFVRRCGPLATLAVLSVGCDTPQKRGLRELSKAGIEPTGKALLEAVMQRDSLRTGWLVDVGVSTEQADAHGRTPVRVAVENGDAPAVFQLLGAKANPNATVEDHVATLGIALEQKQSAIAERLVAAGAQPDGRMPDGEKILPWAIRHGQVDLVKAMLQAGADPHLTDQAGHPLLHLALAAGSRELAEALLARGAEAAATVPAGETTLQLALHHGLAALAPQLAAAGADVDAAGPDGLSLLDQAVAGRDRGQVTLLLRLGADPNRRAISEHGPTPLERAFRLQDGAGIFEEFLALGAKPPDGKWDDFVWRAVATGNREALHLLLQRGARANTRRGGLLPMEAAVLRGDGSTVKLLADYGSPMGNALYHASAHASADLTGLLISCGAPVNATVFPTRDTPLAAALRNHRDLSAALLISHGADLGLATPEGQPMLHLAVATRCHRAVDALLEAGADPNARFAVPVSADFLKCVRPGVMRWILKHDQNATPLMVAADSGDLPLARALIRAGANRETWTKTARLWPINFASRREDVKMMRLFLGRDPLREERRIDIRLSEQRARIYDAVGNQIFTTQVSTGKKGHATPTGEYVITNKYRDWKSTLYHEASMPYFQRLSCGDFGMHQGVVPGYPASHGCIRVPAGNAAKLFTMTRAGDRVRILP